MNAGYKISNWTNMHCRWDVNINNNLKQQYTLTIYLKLQAIMAIKSILQIMVQTIRDGLGEMDDLLLRKVEELTFNVTEKNHKPLEIQNKNLIDEIESLKNNTK